MIYTEKLYEYNLSLLLKNRKNLNLTEGGILGELNIQRNLIVKSFSIFFVSFTVESFSLSQSIKTKNNNLCSTLQYNLPRALQFKLVGNKHLDLKLNHP